MSVAFALPTSPGREPTKLSPRYRSPRFHAAHDTEIVQADDTVIIDGVLNNDRLVVALRSPDHRCTFREQSCVRFSPQELPRIGGVPDHTNRFCDVSPGETSEGLPVVIESHRCYTADSQGNASTLKVRSNIYLTARHFIDCSNTEILPPCPRLQQPISCEHRPFSWHLLQ